MIKNNIMQRAMTDLLHILEKPVLAHRNQFFTLKYVTHHLTDYTPSTTVVSLINDTAEAQ